MPKKIIIETITHIFYNDGTSFCKIDTKALKLGFTIPGYKAGSQCIYNIK